MRPTIYSRLLTHTRLLAISLIFSTPTNITSASASQDSLTLLYVKTSILTPQFTFDNICAHIIDTENTRELNNCLLTGSPTNCYRVLPNSMTIHAVCRLAEQTDRLTDAISNLKNGLSATESRLNQTIDSLDTTTTMQTNHATHLSDLENNIFQEIKKIPDLTQLADYINAQVAAQIDSLKIEMKRDLIRSLRLQIIQDGKDAAAKSDNPKATTKDEL